MKPKTIKSIKEARLGSFYSSGGNGYYYICLLYADKKRIACLNMEKEEAQGYDFNENVLLSNDLIKYWDLFEVAAKDVIWRENNNLISHARTADENPNPPRKSGS